MKLNVKRVFLAGVIMIGLLNIGCMPLDILNEFKRSDIEKVILTVLTPEELISVKEINVESSKKTDNPKKDLVVTLNLAHSAKNIAVDNALLKITYVINTLEEVFKDSLNDYKFIINTNEFDIYGNKQKLKILEISIKNEDIEKINFENFNYKNLEQIAEIKKFNYLKDEIDSKDKLVDDEKLTKDI